ncbi:NmrA family NAD(P)-binding protein [Nocardioides sp. QY071]|uniref:NmrA family NAD(P)-binding protein n=1 Tax=Nocardioides sp. QY071 TaxID=3044187 RepID=UPI00249A1846|nr:NmrA family NAD(P)-binding protein [Nocardioides sp. QY071]WGY00379.1 NmrA family NAD(P)-binding protein [Nocardioides sp. QY071]
MTNDAPFLVTGATGRQGGGTARALLAAGVPVRALVRDPAAPRAVALEQAGAELFRGDLRDRASLEAASRGVRGVFSIQTPLDLSIGAIDFASELTQGTQLVEAARSNDVTRFVHTSVSGAGAWHRNAPGWDEGRWSTGDYFETKAAIQDLVAGAGFEAWTIIKPPTFMDHPLFDRSSVVDGRLVTVIAADTEVPLIAPEDIGAAAAAALLDPATFHGIELDLAGDVLSVGEIAAVLSTAWQEPIVPDILTPEQAVAAGIPQPVVEAQEWFNVVGSPARPEQARSLGLRPITFEEWALATYRD